MRQRTLNSAMRGIVWAIAGLVMACNAHHQGGEVTAPSESTFDWKPFVEMARQSPCAQTRNRLSLIDGALVFWDRRGTCPDNSYAETLYGKTVDDVLCRLHDSIAGPFRNCPVPEYKDIFDIMTDHLDDPALGLGAGHTVRGIPL
ncbi:MAG TPA: hypothetical protein VGR67_07770 [Candidatus Polarisedimenticolia bacterium]|jgi:hypothetical protein|nr:hypothetical protein [Candidatus Polarisedimenticolia bacterium]